MRTAGGFSASGFALNTSAFTDLHTVDAITINSAGLDGQVATVSASIFVQALLGASASDNVISFGSQWQLLVNNGADLNVFDGAGVFPAGSDCSLGCVFNFTLSMIIGTPTSFSIDLSSLAGNGSVLNTSSDFASAFFDLANSVYWNGIQSVTVGGQAISFSLVSDSGHDWTQSSRPDTRV
jgi:hypothetical protein